MAAALPGLPVECPIPPHVSYHCQTRCSPPLSAPRNELTSENVGVLHTRGGYGNTWRPEVQAEQEPRDEKWGPAQGP